MSRPFEHHLTVGGEKLVARPFALSTVWEPLLFQEWIRFEYAPKSKGRRGRYRCASFSVRDLQGVAEAGLSLRIGTAGVASNGQLRELLAAYDAREVDPVVGGLPSVAGPGGGGA